MAVSGIVSGAVAAESKRLTGEMLTETVPGSTIALDTPIGTKIPMRFGADGIVTGEAGILASYLGSAKDRGRWTVENHKLCIKWFRWFESQPRCMEITIDGERITWLRDDGDTGTGTLVEVGQGRVAEKKVSAAKQTVALKQAVATAAASTGAPLPPAAAPPPAPRQAADAAPVAAPAPEAAPAATAEQPQAVVATAAVPPLAPELQMNVGAALPANTNPPSIAVLNPGAEASPAELSAAEPAVSADVPVATPPVQSVAEPAAAPPAAAAVASPPAAAAPAKPRFSPVRETVAPTKPVTAKKAVVAGVAGTAPAKPAKAAAAAKPVGPSFRVARVEPDDMLNIRKGPSEAHAAVGVISSNGRGVKIVGACAGEWCPVKHGGITGWVNRYYLAAE